MDTANTQTKRGDNALWSRVPTYNIDQKKD